MRNMLSLHLLIMEVQVGLRVIANHIIFNQTLSHHRFYENFSFLGRGLSEKIPLADCGLHSVICHCGSMITNVTRL